MRVYFIRHGETELNRKRIHQSPDTRLSPEGIRQSKLLARHLKDKGIEAIYSSDLPRTSKTASIIAGELSIPVGEMSLLREIRRPSSLFGKSHYHPRSFAYVLGMIFNRNNLKWTYEDAETLFAVHARAGKTREMLERVAATHTCIAVVSHAVFLEILMQNLCKDGILNLTDYLPIFSPFSRIRNASISECVCHPALLNEYVCAWEMHSFNDVSHLS